MTPERSNIHFRAEALAAQLPPLLVAADRVASTVSQGVHGRRRVGQGETFWQFRRYQPGDSTQDIDWRQSAKSQPVYIRETEWEAAQSVWLWRDFSASMNYRSSDRMAAKGDRADLLLLALASLLIRGGEYVSLLGSGISPATGRAVLSRLVSLIEAGKQPQQDLPVYEPIPRYGRVVLFGDFLSPLDEIKEAIGEFAGRGVRGHLVQILDPAEESLPFRGRVEFEGLENDGSALIGRVEAVRDEYRQTMAEHRLGLEELIRWAGWTMAVHHTDRSPEAALMGLFLTLSGNLER